MGKRSLFIEDKLLEKYTTDTDENGQFKCKVDFEKYRTEFYKASKIVRNNLGKFSKIKFHSEREYFPFLLKKNNYVIKNSISVAKSLGWTSKLEFSHGGLDANWTVRHGIPTITFGAGQNKIHTKEEFIKINDYYIPIMNTNGCHLFEPSFQMKNWAV